MTDPESSSLPYPFRTEIPRGDSRPRQVCQSCGFIHYVNPKVIVGSVVFHGELILLCKRSIEPRSGYWTLPAGFLEERETTEEGARREAREEALADIEIDALLAIYNIPHISQVQLIYRATLNNPDGFGVGEESEAVELFRRDEIPWDELAFPTVQWALEQSEVVAGQTAFPPFSNPTL